MTQHIDVPQELKHYNQWITWRLVVPEGKTKATKVPNGSSTDSTTWRAYDDACAELASGRGDGLGFVLTSADPFGFLDIDDCGAPGAWNETARFMHAALPGATWETSQSGHGLHALMRCDGSALADKRRKWSAPDGTRCEFYTQERFIALGRCDWSAPLDAPLVDLSAHLLTLVPARDIGGTDATGELKSGPREDYNGPTDDAELIRRACASTGSAAAQFGERATFAQLWNACDTLGQFFPSDDAANPFDHSSADAALMDHLAFWTGCDEQRMARLFGQSALGQRDKWQKRGDYQFSTVRMATRSPNRNYMRHERPDSADVATPGGGESVAPSDDILAQYATAAPERSDHRYMIAIMMEAGFDVRYDEFSRSIIVNGEKISDRLEVDMWFACNERANMNFTKSKFLDAIGHYAGLQTIHPVRDYLDQCAGAWDGVSRADTWLIDYCGAPDTPYVRGVSAAVLIALARRVRSPGCKHDEMLILEGIQGAGKSTVFEKLCPNPDWFTDAVNVNMDTKQVMEVTQGKWIVEAPELSKMSGAEVEHVKALLSRKVDSARLAYGRHAQDWPRQFVFVGTVNGDQYLIDESGNRRFWPVRVADEIDTAGVEAARNQIWGEIAVREARGEANSLPRELWGEAQAAQAARTLANPYEAVLSAKLGTLSGVVAMSDVMEALEVRIKERRAATRQVSAAMRAMGWQWVPERQEFTKGSDARRIRVGGGSGVFVAEVAELRSV